MKLSLSLLLVLMLNFHTSSSRSNLKDALNKAKSYYKSKFGKDKSWHFLGRDPSEYPGTIEKYRKINREKWDDYYNCLKIQNENLGPHGSVTPEAVQGFEGSSVSFDCKICINPKEREQLDSVVWYWTPLSSNELTEIVYTEHILLAPEDKTLTLYNLHDDQTGQYMCKLGQSLTAPYFLTVVNASINLTEVHTRNAFNEPYPQEPDYLSEYNISLDTIWGEWSPCSACEKAGKRHKFGYCVVFIDTQNNEVINKQSFTTDKKSYKRDMQETNPSYEDLELLRIFKNGIPCLSHILPESIKNLPEVKYRSNEIMTGYCKVKCPNAEVFEVKDKQGNIIERANNSAGIYSMRQGMPPVEPLVERLLLYKETEKHVVLSCPGNLNSDSPIQWQIGTKKLVPELVAKQSQGRVYISVTDKIHFKKAKLADSNVYSCWQNNELAGTIRLIVEKKVKLTFNHHIMLFGMVIILAVFLYVFTKAFFGRKYARIIN